MESQKTEQKKSDLKLKLYFCPYCKMPLMKGNVRTLKMECPNCQKMIDSDEKDLFEK